MKKFIVVALSVLLLFCSSCGISQLEYEEAVSDARQEGYDEGKDVGYDEGYAEGYDEGYSEGESYGYETGFSEGADEGMSDGYSDGYEDGLLENRQELVFFRNNACIVTTSGYKYHHYGCYHIEGRRYYIYNIELAESKGYTPCLDCWEDGLLLSLVLPGNTTN